MVYEYNTQWKNLPLSAFEKAHGIKELDNYKAVDKLMEKYNIW